MSLPGDQLHNSDRHREDRDALFQQFRLQKGGIVTPDPDADAMTDDRDSQHAGDGQEVALKRVPDAGRDGDKDRVKERYAYRSLDRNAHQNQQRHDEHRTAGFGQCADGAGNQSE